jgi:nicotinamide-nucleotide amidase
MNIELINTGSELMLGRVLNTHQQWLCRQLADRGYVVSRQVAVADTAAEIQQAVREAISRADLVITTGGLGPTTDDLTRDAIAALLGRQLHEDKAIAASLETWFTSRKRPMPPSIRIQAMVPDGALVLPNANGTAPGLIMETPTPAGTPVNRAACLVMLPGPPRELRPMFSDQVLPWLTRRFPLAEPFACRTLRTTGIGESAVQERIAGPLADLVARGLEIGYCARVGEVDVRLAAGGEPGMSLIAAAESRVRELVGRHIFGVEDDTLEAAVVRRLTERRQTLVVAESCTGGRLASRITDVPGASAVFLGGAVTYSNALKQGLLGVHAETLAAHGAVSEATAREMAEGARRRFDADFALAVTGIAGPTGGTDAKPVGTVFIALATAHRTTVLAPVNRYDRETFKNVTSQQALELLRQELLK